MSNGKYLYKDDNHLNNDGAIYIASKIRQQVHAFVDTEE